ncbi:pseudouridine synthase [Vibrio galatheae]|uniref:Pseudouridine synthase n=1 Tax=Vibrio galatheae TaxID=579748 RepID=A0A0F4NRA2_9VIBR|nr:YqcC family protein [Vibrio galatheae]KJY85383.1 pseudouridine synthase [Vibrio galatheae]
MTKEKQLAALLDQLEHAMQQHQIWPLERPSQQALQSEQPFALDTLQPHEWLRWVFIDKMHHILSQSQPLPQGFALAPYFEQCWSENPALMPVIAILQQIDEECR